MPEKRKGFTTIAISKEARDWLRSKKTHRRQSDDEVLRVLMGGKKRKKKSRRGLPGITD